MHNRVTGLGSIFLVSAVIGCGAGGGGKPTSLPPTTKLVSLTPSQQTQICIDFTNYSVKNVSMANFCKFAGVEMAAYVLASDSSTPDTTLKDACSQAVTDCNSAPPDTSGSTCDFSSVSSCTADATIADFNACVSDEVAAQDAAFASLPPCQTITKSWLNANANTAGQIPLPASCVSLSTKCPGISM